MTRFLRHKWLRFGEFLAGKYLKYHPEAWHATSLDGVEGEFDFFVAFMLVALPTAAQFNVRTDFEPASVTLLLLVSTFVVMVKARQFFFRRFLLPTRLVYLATGRT